MKHLGTVVSVMVLSASGIATASAQSGQGQASTTAPEMIPDSFGSPAPMASEPTGTGVTAPTETAAPAPEAASAEPLPTIPVNTETPPVEEPVVSGSKNRMIEEIIVTAQKREEAVKDVPISIAAFSADYLDAKGVVQQQDLPKITPGLTIGGPAGFATTYIRGIGSDAFILADPLVVTYIDGVYFPASSTQFQDFGDVERVEVLKGPQGTLFGRNALGGVISIVTKDPSLTDFQASAKATYQSYTGSDPSRNAVNTSGSLSLPLTDSLAVGISGLYNWNDPYYDLRIGGLIGEQPIVDSGRSWAYRAKIVWQPMDDLKIKLNVYKFDDKDPSKGAGVNSVPSPLAVGGVPQDPFEGGTLNLTKTTNKGLTYFGSADLSTQLANIQLLLSHQKIVSERYIDFDATPIPIAAFEGTDRPPNQGPFFSNNQSIELRFLSNDSTPDWLSLVGGLYWYNQDSGARAASLQVAGTNLEQGQIGGFTIPGLQDLITPLTNLVPLLPQGAQLLIGGGLNDRAVAGYLQSTFKFTDAIALTLGARYQRDKRYVLYANQGVNLNDETQVILFHYSGRGGPVSTPIIGTSLNNFNPKDYQTETNTFDPKVSLNFRFDDGWLGSEPLLYLNYQTASTGNIFNTTSLLSPPDLAKGSKIYAYEVGLKTYLFDRLVSLDTAAFHYKMKDGQSQVISVQSGGAVHFENVPETRTVGAEFSAVSQILPSLTADGLVLTMSAAYLDSEYTDYSNASGFSPELGLYSQNNDFTGNRVVQTPKLTANVGLSQTLQIPGGPLETGVDFYYNSGFYYLAQNTANTEVKAYKTLGFTVSYLYERWNTRITAFGRNILDERYLAGRFPNDFGGMDIAAPLSIYGLTLVWNY